MAIKIIINGAFGKMGTVSSEAISQDNDFALLARLSKDDNLAEQIQSSDADVVVDFTNAKSVYENTEIIIANGARPIIGSSGLLPEQVQALQKQCRAANLGGIIAPNFSIGAVLMIKYAREMAYYYSHAEIIEMHHEKKQDAPSGTAVKTANMIAETLQHTASSIDTHEIVQGARGANCENIPVHSVRLPGLVAHQQVIFGGEGETLTLRHDTIDRSCFMPGLITACKKVMQLDELIYGLENIL